MRTLTAPVIAIIAALSISACGQAKPAHRELACPVASQCAHLQQTHPDVEVIYYPKAKAA